MRFIQNSALIICFSIALILTSCETNEVTKISLSQSAISMNVGQSDSLHTTITYTGDITNQPTSWIIENTEIISIVEKGTEMSSKGSETNLSKSIVVKGLKVGSSKLTIKVGEKSMSCQVTVNQTSFSFNQAFTSNWGDYYEYGTNNFDMYLLESTLSTDAEGKLTGNGNYIYLEFNVPIMQDNINEADFILSTTGAANTFFPGDTIQSDGQTYFIGSRVVNKSGTSNSIKRITDGSFSIKSKGSGFLLEGDVTTEDNEVIHFKYEGKLDVTDNREEVVELSPKFTHGRLYYYGDAYNSTTSNNFVAYLATENVDFNASQSEGELLMLEFNTALSVTNYIPSGTYNMMTKLDLASLVPFSLIFGYTAENGDEWGTWYYGQTSKKLTTGNIKVSKSGENYIINYELYDKIGSKVSGTYTGPLEYFNGTAASNSVSAQKVKRAGVIKEFPEKHIRIKKNKDLGV